MARQRPSEDRIAIARVYARAALGLAERQGLADALLEELEALVGALDKSPDLDAYLTSPLVDRDERRQGLERLFRGRLSELLVDTLQVMNRKGRAALLRSLALAYREEYEKLKGIVEVKVATAVPLAKELRQRLEETLSRLTGKQLWITERVDQALLGGLVLEVGDRKFDASVARELRILASRMRERAAHEMFSGRTFATGD